MICTWLVNLTGFVSPRYNSRFRRFEKKCWHSVFWKFYLLCRDSTLVWVCRRVRTRSRSPKKLSAYELLPHTHGHAEWPFMGCTGAGERNDVFVATVPMIRNNEAGDLYHVVRGIHLGVLGTSSSSVTHSLTHPLPGMRMTWSREFGSNKQTNKLARRMWHDIITASSSFSSCPARTTSPRHKMLFWKCSMF